MIGTIVGKKQTPQPFRCNCLDCGYALHLSINPHEQKKSPPTGESERALPCCGVLALSLWEASRATVSRVGVLLGPWTPLCRDLHVRLRGLPPRAGTECATRHRPVVVLGLPEPIPSLRQALAGQVTGSLKPRVSEGPRVTASKAPDSCLTFSPLGPESPLRPGSPGGPCGGDGRIRAVLPNSTLHHCRGASLGSSLTMGPGGPSGPGEPGRPCSP